MPPSITERVSSERSPVGRNTTSGLITVNINSSLVLLALFECQAGQCGFVKTPIKEYIAVYCSLVELNTLVEFELYQPSLGSVDGINESLSVGDEYGVTCRLVNPDPFSVMVNIRSASPGYKQTFVDWNGRVFVEPHVERTPRFEVGHVPQLCVHLGRFFVQTYELINLRTGDRFAFPVERTSTCIVCVLNAIN